jgi:hypothetical protein
MELLGMDGQGGFPKGVDRAETFEGDVKVGDSAFVADIESFAV